MTPQGGPTSSPLLPPPPRLPNRSLAPKELMWASEERCLQEKDRAVTQGNSLALSRKQQNVPLLATFH